MDEGAFASCFSVLLGEAVVSGDLRRYLKRKERCGWRFKSEEFRERSAERQLILHAWRSRFMLPCVHFTRVSYIFLNVFFPSKPQAGTDFQSLQIGNKVCVMAFVLLQMPVNMRDLQHFSSPNLKVLLLLDVNCFLLLHTFKLMI